MQPDPQHPFGRLLKGAGYALTAVGAFASMLWLGASADAPVWSLLLGLALVAAGGFIARIAGNVAYRLGERFESGRPDQIDERVLYLRAFSSDGPAPPVEEPQFLAVGSNEQQLVRMLERQVGDVIALGRPGEGLPTAGAVRTYAEEADWKLRVRRYLHACGLTVIYYASGAGHNLRWEMRTALAEVHPSRILFVFAGPESWRTFRTLEAALFHAPLPASDSVQYLGFESDGRPVALMEWPTPVPEPSGFGPSMIAPDPSRLDHYLAAAAAGIPITPAPSPASVAFPILERAELTHDEAHEVH